MAIKTRKEIKGRIIFAVILAIAWGGVLRAYDVVEAPFLASIAKDQLNDSVIEYSVIQELMKGGHGQSIINFVFVILILLVVRTMFVNVKDN